MIKCIILNIAFEKKLTDGKIKNSQRKNRSLYEFFFNSLDT